MSTTDPDTMTPEQLRDALAVAAFGTTSVYLKDSDGGPGRRENPIPPLDSPEALGVVAGMMPKGWRISVENAGEFDHEWDAWAWRSVISKNVDNDPDFTGDGPTETIARARLVLKVLAAQATAAR